MISNCGHDERWAYSGGVAGDNNGTEWQLVGWYSYPWNVMLRYPNAEVRHWMGDQARAAALNDCIGYDQGQRGTFWVNLADSDYDVSQITVRCEADCSSGVLAIAKAAGYHFGIDALKGINHWGTTWGEEQILKDAGFEVHREYKYLNSDAYLDNGDVLLNTQNHTAFNVTKGKYCDAEENYNTPSNPKNNNGLWYKGHCQTYGWLPKVHDGMISGTEGKSKRLEALIIDPPEGVVLDVDVHLQKIGWQHYEGIRHGNDRILGTTGESRRLEAIKITCTENNLGKELKCQVHCQTYGWLDTVGEGEIAGTTGESKRMESIRIWFE